MKFSHYLFDFDGTLVDSMPYWSQKMLNILNETKTPYPENVISIITPLGDVGTAVYFRDVLGVPLTNAEMYEKMDAYALPCYRDKIPLKADVLECLKRLRAKGCSLNILTASPHKALDPCLRRLGIWDLFDNIWSSDDFRLSKSNPQIYLEAVKLMGTVAAETAFFDDNLTAIRTAKEAGLYTVGVYDVTAIDFRCELEATADRYITSFSEICSLSE
ncbi:MAG: HAD family phosphatase [Ruminococcaceae bacterium]|nr:HAD family phosphatase [Oscillospiraceae bacterium]